MDPINAPSHYIAETPDGRRIEVIEIIEAYGLGYHLGNVVKYLCRAGRKTLDQRDDLRKALKYLEFAGASRMLLGVYIDERRRTAPLPRDIAAAYGLDARCAQALGIVLQAYPHRCDMPDAAAHLTAALGEIEDAMLERAEKTLALSHVTLRLLDGDASVARATHGLLDGLLDFVHDRCHHESRYSESGEEVQV